MKRGAVTQGQARAALLIFDKRRADAWLDRDGALRVACRGDRRRHVISILGEPFETVAGRDGAGEPFVFSLVYQVTP